LNVDELALKFGPVSEQDGHARWTGDLTAEALAVLVAARRIEGDRDKARRWFHDIGIDELDGLTAAELVSRGRSADVLAFLGSIGAGARD